MRPLLYTLSFILPLLLLLNLAAAQRAVEPLDVLIDAWGPLIDVYEEELAGPIEEDRMEEVRIRVEELRTAARTEMPAQSEKVGLAEERLQDLGPAPEEGAEPEAEVIAQERAERNEALAAAASTLRRLELVIAETSRLLDLISDRRRDRFLDEVFKRESSPLMPDIWQEGLPEAKRIALAAADGFVGWLGQLVETGRSRALWFILAGLGVAFVLGWPLRRWLLRQPIASTTQEDPSYIARIARAAWVGSVRSLLPILALLVIYGVLDRLRLLEGDFGRLGLAALWGGIIIVLVTALSRTVLSPRFRNWRLLPVNDQQAGRLRRLFNAIAVVLALDHVLQTLLLAVNASIELFSLYGFIVALLYSFLLFRLASAKLWARDDAEEPRSARSGRDVETEEEGKGSTGYGWFPLVIATLAIAIPIAGALGYVPLARFVARQIVITGGILLLAWMLRQLLQEMMAYAFSADSGVGKALRRSLTLSDRSCDLLGFWLGLLLDAALLFITVPVIMLRWGVSSAEMSDWLEVAFFGFRIGDVTISFSNVLVAIFLFLLFLSFARLLQRFLGERLLPRTGMDKGIQDSLRIGVGYIGFVIAAAVGISQLGLDLSNLAIVAGALSVGIGFGLQSVVNNFVSGLILLVERPIKVGDWVVVGAEQGYVKRIKVRATEIETFERASVIIPNSDLISGTVKNWFHGNRVGRGEIRIGVSYGSDAEQVRKVLLDIAEKESMVSRYPSPVVDFLDFGDSALLFRLRFFLNDMDYVLSTSSRMRFEILKRFREEGIEIPFPQRDLHVRSGLVALSAEEQRALPSAKEMGDQPTERSDGKSTERRTGNPAEDFGGEQT